MLAAAFASRLHWNAIGTDQNRAVGDWQIGHVASHLGLGDLALRFSTRCLDTTTANAWGDLYLASAHEGVARAHATLGDKAERDRHADLCRTALDAIADPEDRAVIERQLATVPKV